MSGYQDSNLGPPGPKPGALAGLRYTPKNITYKRTYLINQKDQKICSPKRCGERGIRTPDTVARAAV